jgi:hypothetical protein
MNQWIEKIEQIEKINKELLEACRAMEEISSLWLPTETSPEHRGEAVALHSMRCKILNVISAAEGRP